MSSKFHTAVIAATLLICSGLASAPRAEAAALAVYQGNGCDGVKQLPQFTQWFGRQPDLIVDFFAMESWQSMMDDANWTIWCWAQQNRKVVFSVPMLPNGNDTLADGAAGKFDHIFTQLAQEFVKNGYGDAIIRLGWEFNGGWYPWAAAKDPANWVNYWRRIVTTMRAVSPTFRFDWCSAQGWQQLPPAEVYPGDAYVDIIGRDTYNQSWSPEVTTPEQRWNELLTGHFGLEWLEQFAQAHNKPMSMPEWGTGTRPDGHGGGDDAYFITRMAEWMRSRNLIYHGYWDFPAADFNAKLSNGKQPLAGAAFLAAFRAVPKAPSSVAVRKGS